VALVSEAQQPGKLVPRVGFLGNADPKSALEPLDAFREGLRELGWIEGQTIAIEEIVTKRLQLLTETIPGLSRLAVLCRTGSPGRATRDAVTVVAPTLALQPCLLEVGAATDYSGALRAARDGRAQATEPLLQCESAPSGHPGRALPSPCHVRV